MEKLGIAITMAWSLLCAYLIYTRWEDAAKMSLNEWGDFLAGITAPIAFLWLIIGYMLQRKELKLNTDALLLTKDEMARQANEMSVQTDLLKTQARLAEGQLGELNTKRVIGTLGSIFKND
ncbi:hypothetical protein ACTG1T_18145 [Aeromonas veronii]|uniref:hypothetical protein n=1 Tax=Aeromonas veronii TaxID=654 RepID=UPI003F7A26C5